MSADRISDDSSQSEHIVREALGQSEAFLAFQEQLSRVARVDRPVLLIGERGTGKELAALRLHYLSNRWQEPFVALNCAALPPTLIESELFGHEQGAFTGAAGRRAGRFEAAHGGTLFLDEIGAIPIEAQEKILRVVEYGSFERVGGSQSIHVDVRIVGATNADLRAMVAEERFKHDLLDRLSFEVLFLPPLRERHEDIMLLATHFATRMAYDLGWPNLPEFDEAAVDKIESHPWRGNIRELKNVVERAVYRSEDAAITADEIVFDPFEPPFASMSLSRPPVSRTEPLARTDRTEESRARSASAESDAWSELEGLPFADAMRAVELRLLRKGLERAQYNQRRAAQLMGLSYHQFRGLYRKYRDELGAMPE